MIPFTSSMLLGCRRPGRYPVQSFVIIDPPGLAFKENSPDGVNISIPGSAKMGGSEGDDQRTKDISDAEWILLETIDCRSNRPLHTGPFLTVQRRRRRRKYVRTYLFKDPTLIDDLSAYQTNFVLDRISNWEFNAFILDNVTGGRPLPNLCVHLFKMYGLLEHFNLDPVTVWKVFSIIEDGYHWRNPYHNAVHAADVTQAMHCFLQESMILQKLTKVEILSALLAAVTHDLDHPGVNQPFLVATSNHLAALYKNSSVLENHHWRSAMGCLHESGMSQVLGPELVQTIEWQIRSLVLATDITRQREFLDKLKEYLDTDTLDMDNADVRHFVLQIALKCADICNPCRPWEISRKWSMKVCEEFFRQGDYERQLNLPVTSLCDRYSTSVPKIQTGFLQYVVQPLFKEWHRMMATPLSSIMKRNLEFNHSKWDQLLADEEAQETMTETSDTEDTTTEIPQHTLEDESDTITIRVASIKTGRERTHHQRRDHERSVRFDIDTTVTEASDSDNSDNDNNTPSSSTSPIRRSDKFELRSSSPEDKTAEREFLGIPRPDGRRHSIATGLMGNIPVPPAQLLSTMMTSSNSSSSSNHPSNADSIVSSSRMVGRTVIRRESLPTSNLLPGRALPSKTILHLQRLSAKAISEQHDQHTGPSSSPRAESTSPPDLPVSPGGGRLTTSSSYGEKSSCSSTSTVDEILDFTYSLPEHGGSRSSSSPRRLESTTTDLDELYCPPTSILSMSPSVAHVTLQQSIEVDEQRRHLIRQQTCPVVSVHFGEGGAGGSGSGSFNRPRFLSAAAAISPTAVASSSIISQHRRQNRSPETGQEDGAASSSSCGGGRMSGGSSNEGLMSACREVISEEGADHRGGGSGTNSSTEASPLEIFVQQFPPASDDNGEAPPRRGSRGSTSNMDNSESNTNDLESGLSQCNNDVGNVRNTNKYRSKDSLLFGDEDCDFNNHFDSHFDETTTTTTTFPCSPSTSTFNCSKPVVTTNDTSTQTEEDSSLMKDLLDPICPAADEQDPAIMMISSFQCSSSVHNAEKEGKSHHSSSSTNTVSTSTSSSSHGSSSNNNRLATLMMWRNNRVWKSLTEDEDPEDDNINPSSCNNRFLLEDQDHLPKFCERWDLRFSQQTHQGVLGARLQIRRGSAPTNFYGPSLGVRGAQDRRSDPTHYHSDCRYDPTSNNNNPSLIASSLQGGQLRRGSIPIDLFRQTPGILRPIPQSKTNNKSVPTRRRGSLPTEPVTTSDHGPLPYKWMPMLPYCEDDLGISMKRRSSGGPELFAAAQSKTSLSMKQSPMLFENNLGGYSFASETTSSGGGGGGIYYWPGRRRGSLPVEVCIASSVSCSSESESSAGDSSDT